MRHPSARVVLVACLLAATAAAQAPDSPRGFADSRHNLAPSHGGGTPGGLDPASIDQPNTSESEPTPSWSVSRFDAERFRQDPDYSLYGMFQQAHGTFMAGMARYEPMISIDLGVYPNMRIKNEPGSFDLLRYGIDADFPIALSPDGYLLLGFYANARDYDFTSSTTLADEEVYAVGLKFGFGAFLDENTLLQVETQPGIWSDMDSGLHHEDYDFPSSALMTFRTTDALFWKAGVRYNQIFEDAPWLPYLGVSWHITAMMTPEGMGPGDSGSWRLDVLLPEYAELSWWPAPDTGYQWGFEVDGGEYHVRTSAATGNQRDDIHVQEVTTYLGMTHRMSDTFSIRARAGATLAGNNDLTNGANGFTKVDGALDHGFFASVSFGIDW